MTVLANQLDLSPLPPASRREKTTKTQATKYNFSDLCGSLSWKGDAVATQRSIRDEW